MTGQWRVQLIAWDKVRTEITRRDSDQEEADLTQGTIAVDKKAGGLFSREPVIVVLPISFSTLC